MKTQLLAFTLAAIWALVVVVSHNGPPDKPTLGITDLYPTKSECHVAQRRMQTAINQKNVRAFATCEEYKVTRADLNPPD